jgi:hypothetical protein
LRPLRLHKILAKWQFPCIWSCCLISATDLSNILRLLQRNTLILRISWCAHGQSSIKWRRFLDGAREAKQVTTMKIRRGEKESWGTPSRTSACLLHVVSPLFGVLRYAGRSANARGWGWSAEGRKLSLMHPRDNLEGLYKDAVVDLTTLQNSHNLTMTDLDKKRSELALLQGSVDGLHDHCPPRILHSRRTYELCRGLKRRSWRF